MIGSAGPTQWPEDTDVLRYDGYVWSVRLLLAMLTEYADECGTCERCIRAGKLMARVEAWNAAVR